MLRRIVFLLWVALAHTTTALAAPQNGWWWNPNESGRGFFIEIVDGFAYIGAYVYAPDGRADWVVSQGTMTTPTSYSGRLLSFRGGQTLVGAYRAPGPASDVGAIGIQFTDDTHATLTWPGGTIPIERLTFAASGPEPLPGTAWWWDATQPGTGYSIEVQGTTLFLVAFMYDEAGNPLWYYSAGTMASEDSYRGALLRFANGQPIVGAYRPPGPPLNVGSIEIEFTAPNVATIVLSDVAASARVAFKQMRNADIQPVLTPKLPPLPNLWAGEVRTKWAGTSVTGLTIDYDYTVRLTATDPLIALDGEQVHPVVGSMTLRASHGGRNPPFTSCTGTGRDTNVLDGDNELRMNNNTGKYVLQIREELAFSLFGSCTGGPLPTTPYNPSIQGGVFMRHIADITVDRLGSPYIRGHRRMKIGDGIEYTESWILRPVQ